MIYRHGEGGGAYTIDAHIVATTIQPEFNSSGQLIRSVKRLLIEGAIRGTSQSDIKTKCQALQAAFLGSSVQKSGFLHSDGTTAANDFIDITGVTTEQGIVCSVAWLDRGTEYVLKRSFQVEVVASMLGAGAEEFAFSRRIIRIGQGGPVRVGRLTQGGALIQAAYPASLYQGLEIGQKSSRLGFVAAEAPTFPAITNFDDCHIDVGSDRGPDGVTRYFASWTYRILSTSAF